MMLTTHCTMMMSSSSVPALPSIPALSQSISIASLVDNYESRVQILLLPPIIVLPDSDDPAPASCPQPVPDSRFAQLNPALFLNDQRPTHRDDAEGFGPSIINADKWAIGIRCFDNPVCPNPAHDTGNKRLNVYRQMSTCRSCVLEAVAKVPAHATHMQTVRFVTALFRNYFCPFCLLEQDDRSKMHEVAVKNHCLKHWVINRFIHCRHSGQLWQNCKLCLFDPRAATAVCACGNLLRDKHLCTCDPSLKALSYGIRFHTNPFKVPTAAEQEQDAEWVRFCLEEAASMSLRKDELVQQLPPKRARKNPARRAPYLKPYLAAPQGDSSSAAAAGV